MGKMFLAFFILFMAMALNSVNAQEKNSKNIIQSNQLTHIVPDFFLSKNYSYNLIDSEIVTDTIKQEAGKISSRKAPSKDENIWKNIGRICSTIIVFGWLIIEVILRKH